MLLRVVGLPVILCVAIAVGVATVFGVALLGHELLVLRYGENLAPIDDTPVMTAAVDSSSLAGILAGLVVLIAGWRRVLRRRD